jgi:maltose O-acetyltransferase
MPRSQPGLAGGDRRATNAGATVRLWHRLSDDLTPIEPRLWAALALGAPLPPLVGSRLRSYLLRMAGFSIGRGTLLYGMPSLLGGAGKARRLRIGRQCLLNVGCVIDLAEAVTIGDRVGVGPQVLFLTASHEIGPAAKRAGALNGGPIAVEDGVWIGARAMILPGVTVGTGSVVSAGVQISKDVPPDTLVTNRGSVSLARWRR